MTAFVTWLVQGALGPAAFALPVNWAAGELSDAARQWFRRLRRTDDLSRLVRAAVGSSFHLSNGEFGAIRDLLGKDETWVQLGHGSVDQLAGQIASCVPAGGDRTAEDSRVAGMTIARGLLEFAVFKLDPETFKLVVQARLQRLADHADALDTAMLDLHADLTAGFAAVLEQLKQVLNRLPPGTAGRGEIVIYLTTLVAWLNKDPWPQDPQLHGPALTPAVIERKLRIATGGPEGKADLDADDVAKQCRRLVILGGAGSGKTWLAKRIARRCAEEALEALAAGAALDELEVPLYTTCARLFAACAFPGSGDIREAAVSSAINHIGDLGGLTGAIRGFFTHRRNWAAGRQSEPTLLVIDSLDEASGSDDPLREATTLPWRIVLTSRQSAWNGQLSIEQGNDSHRVGELQPLRYPDDVEPFIYRWFERRPDRGSDLAAQLAWRPGLQQAATVPLFLAFYCIIGGDESLPDFRHELYTRVLARILRGYWHGSQVGGTRELDVPACLQTLQQWAWSGASGPGDNHPLSGVGTWADDVRTQPCGLDENEQGAVDHVAFPLGPADLDTQETLRHFIHRSIREQLVAEHVAALPVIDAAGILLPHLWHDSDWEDAVPAAVALHPQRDQLLQELISGAGAPGSTAGDLSVIDGGWQVREVLAGVAAQSSETDWLPENAGLIARARVDLARSGRPGALGGAPSWETSNHDAKDVLLGMLAGLADHRAAGTLADGVARLAGTAQQQGQAREALLTLLSSAADAWIVQALMPVIIRLAPAAADKRQARDALLKLLDHQTDVLTADMLVGGLTQLEPAEEDKSRAWQALLRLLGDGSDFWAADTLGYNIVRLAPAAADKNQAKEVLLKLLARDTGWSLREIAEVALGLASTEEDKLQVRDALLEKLAGSIDPWMARWMMQCVVELTSTAGDQGKVTDKLLTMLGSTSDGPIAQLLVDSVVQLAPSAEAKQQAVQELSWMLANHWGHGWTSEAYADGLIRLGASPEEKSQAREALLGTLAGREAGWAAEHLAASLLLLGPAAGDKQRAREASLRWLAEPADGQLAAALGHAIAQLDPTPEDKRLAREELLEWLADPDSLWVTRRLASAVVRLAPAAEDKPQALDGMLGLLAGAADRKTAEVLADSAVTLAPTAEEKGHARQALLEMLDGATDGGTVPVIARCMLQLEPTAQDGQRARAVLAALLPSLAHGPAFEMEPGTVISMSPGSEDERRVREVVLGPVGVIIQLGPTEEETHLALETLLRWLADPGDQWQADAWVAGVVQLAASEQNKRYAREAMLGQLPSQTKDWAAAALISGVTRLDPAIEDLNGWHTWTVPPSPELLAAVRRNTALPIWLTALPALAPLSQPS
jgi:hypothetical protein